ncbi:MAG: ABC transporter permease [Pseudomonadota bacterium]
MPMIKQRLLPIFTVVAAIITIWYAGAIFLNAPFEYQTAARADQQISFAEVLPKTMAQQRPVLPAPHQVAQEIWKTTGAMVMRGRAFSNRSLINHAWVTLSATLLGFVLGTALGILLAVGIVHSKVMAKSVMPWVITSQTIPILAIAPMIIVVLASIGLTGLMPKSLISMYLSFFPVTVGMVKGLKSPEVMHMDLMHTYSASRSQTFWKLRWPSSLPYLFTSMKIGIAASLVGAIVGELPTGAVAGLGARLLAGSYYGQTVQIWSALIIAAICAGLLVTLIGIIGDQVNRRMGIREASN